MSRYLIALTAGAVLAASACGGPDNPGESAHTKKLAPLPPAGHGGPPDGGPVAFRARDGVGLRGRLFGSGRAAVVLVHMGNAQSNQADWYPLARVLAREGYMVLTYNSRGVCSEGKGKYDCSAGIPDYGTSWQDVVGAVNFVKEKGARRVAVAGASIGATSSVYATAAGRIHPAALISMAGVNYVATYDFDQQD